MAVTTAASIPTAFTSFASKLIDTDGGTRPDAGVQENEHVEMVTSSLVSLAEPDAT